MSCDRCEFRFVTTQSVCLGKIHTKRNNNNAIRAVLLPQWYDLPFIIQMVRHILSNSNMALSKHNDLWKFIAKILFSQHYTNIEKMTLRKCLIRLISYPFNPFSSFFDSSSAHFLHHYHSCSTLSKKIVFVRFIVGHLTFHHISRVGESEKKEERGRVRGGGG